MKPLYILTILHISLFFVVSCNFKESENEMQGKQPAINLEHTVHSPDGKFTISFPGKPEFSTESVASDEGILENNMYMYEYSQEIVYMLAYTEYEIKHIFGYDPYELLDNAMNGFVEEVGILVQKKEKIKTGEHPGIEFIASGTEYHAHICDYLVENRLYQIGILSSAGQIEPADADAFFSSFKLHP